MSFAFSVAVSVLRRMSAVSPCVVNLHNYVPVRLAWTVDKLSRGASQTRRPLQARHCLELRRRDAVDGGIS